MKGSYFRLLSLLSSKWIEKRKAFWWNEKEWADKCDRHDSDFDAISVRNILGFFFVIFTGVACSLIALLCIYIYRKIKPHPPMKIVIEMESETNIEITKEDTISVKSDEYLSVKQTEVIMQRRRCRSF